MSWMGSHERRVRYLRILGVFLGLGIPLGYVGSFLKEKGVRQAREEGLAQVIRAEARTQVARVEKEFESLRVESLAFARQRLLVRKESEFSIQGRILHWSELEARDPALGYSVRFSVKNANWNVSSGIVQVYLKAVLDKLNSIPSTDHSDSFIFRMKQDVLSEKEWLSVAFSSPEFPKEKWLVLVEPSQVFKSFENNAWISDSNKRVYLVGSDGRVLIHSEKVLSWSDFGSLSLFKNEIGKVLDATVDSGIAKGIGFDRLPVQAAYIRVKNLPLVVVVEQRT